MSLDYISNFNEYFRQQKISVFRYNLKEKAEKKQIKKTF